MARLDPALRRKPTKLGQVIAKVGDRLRVRQGELDTLKAKLVEPEEETVDKDELVLEVQRWIGPLVNMNDPVQVRQVLRHLGISRIVISPDPSGGWAFDGGANLAGLVGVKRDSRRSPRFPPPVARCGCA